MPKVMYTFRGGPLNGRTLAKAQRGRAPFYLDESGQYLRYEYGRRIAESRLGLTHLRSQHGKNCYARWSDPTIVDGAFTYVYNWTGVAQP